MGFTKGRKVPTLIQAQLKKQSDASSVSQERKEQGFLSGSRNRGIQKAGGGKFVWFAGAGTQGTPGGM